MKKKVLSLVLCLAMIVSVFCCIPAVEVGAAGNDTQMLHYSAYTNSNLKYNYAGIAFNYKMKLGKKYRFSLDWENINVAPFTSKRNDTATFQIKLMEDDNQYWDARYYASDYTETVTQLSHGQHRCC